MDPIQTNSLVVKQEENVDKAAKTSEKEAFNEALKQFMTMTGSPEHLKNVGNFDIKWVIFVTTFYSYFANL